jgi:hypothetical protein
MTTKYVHCLNHTFSRSPLLEVLVYLAVNDEATEEGGPNEYIYIDTFTRAAPRTKKRVNLKSKKK